MLHKLKDAWLLVLNQDEATMKQIDDIQKEVRAAKKTCIII